MAIESNCTWTRRQCEPAAMPVHSPGLCWRYLRLPTLTAAAKAAAENKWPTPLISHLAQQTDARCTYTKGRVIAGFETRLKEKNNLRETTVNNAVFTSEIVRREFTVPYCWILFFALTPLLTTVTKDCSYNNETVIFWTLSEAVKAYLFCGSMDLIAYW